MPVISHYNYMFSLVVTVIVFVNNLCSKNFIIAERESKLHSNNFNAMNFFKNLNFLNSFKAISIRYL